jgi:hypothetical protein
MWRGTLGFWFNRLKIWRFLGAVYSLQHPDRAAVVDWSRCLVVMASASHRKKSVPNRYRLAVLFQTPASKCFVPILMKSFST